MTFRLVPKSVTLNDLERRNGRYFALFHHCAKVVELSPYKKFTFAIGPIANLKGPYFQPSLSVSLSVCLCVCVSLTGTSTLQR